MKFPTDLLDAVQSTYGYTARECHFLYIVATHSGHFLGRHFLEFTNATRGKALQNFIEKAAAHRHIRETRYSEAGANRYHLYSKPLYAALGKVNSSHRRKHGTSKTVVKLLTLDFVLQHLDGDYLDEEPDKMRYFHEQLAVEKPYLPLRVYKSANSNKPPTTRYFVDKYPLFLDADGVVSFTYIDDPLVSTQAFRTHLFQYLPLFNRLNVPFRVWFVSPVPGKFPEAERAFNTLLSSHSAGFAPEVLAYFDLRCRWEAKDLRGFTPEVIRQRFELEKKYAASHYETLYQEWLNSQKKGAGTAGTEPTAHAAFATCEVRA